MEVWRPFSVRASLSWKVYLLIKKSNDGRRIELSSPHPDVGRRLVYFVEVYQFATHLSPNGPSVVRELQAGNSEAFELDQRIHTLARLLSCSPDTAIVAACVVALAASSYNTTWMLCIDRLCDLLNPEQEDAPSSTSSNSTSSNTMSTSSSSSFRPNSLSSNLFSLHTDISPMLEADEKSKRAFCENTGVLTLVRKKQEGKQN